jgi:hypothetical protein
LLQREARESVADQDDFRLQSTSGCIAICSQLSTAMWITAQELNFGEHPRYLYRHPIIQRVINITWFQNKEDDGIVFHDFFTPIPIEVIALALTVVRIEVTHRNPEY